MSNTEFSTFFLILLATLCPLRAQTTTPPPGTAPATDVIAISRPLAEFNAAAENADRDAQRLLADLAAQRPVRTPSSSLFADGRQLVAKLVETARMTYAQERQAGHIQNARAISVAITELESLLTHFAAEERRLDLEHLAAEQAYGVREAEVHAEVAKLRQDAAQARKRAAELAPALEEARRQRAADDALEAARRVSAAEPETFKVAAPKPKGKPTPQPQPKKGPAPK
jgi:hypothetical protein